MGAIGRADEAEKPAVVVGDRVTTFQELEARTNQLAHVLIGRGVEPLDRVAVMLANGREFLEAGLAAAKAAAEIVPINWHLKRDEVAWILADSGAKVLVADAAFGEVVDGVLETAPACSTILVGSAGADDYEQLLGQADPERPSRDGFAAPEYFFYTSGTTGRPRGVERDPPEVGRPPAVLPVAMMWGLTGDDTYLVASPLYHATCAYAFTHLYLGSTVVCPPRWDAAEWLRLVEEHRVTVGFVTPAHLIRILEVPDAERESRDLSSLRLLLHAAAPCPVAVKEKALAAFPSTTRIDQMTCDQPHDVDRKHRWGIEQGVFGAHVGIAQGRRCSRRAALEKIAPDDDQSHPGGSGIFLRPGIDQAKWRDVDRLAQDVRRHIANQRHIAGLRHERKLRADNGVVTRVVEIRRGGIDVVVMRQGNAAIVRRCARPGSSSITDLLGLAQSGCTPLPGDEIRCVRTGT
jgi:acyl-CoA synthetase (AMP-forming)/AMP-acid ligase II